MTLLARAFLAGPLDAQSILARVAPFLRRKRQAPLEEAIERLLAHFGPGTRPSTRRVAAFLEGDRDLRRWLQSGKHSPLKPAGLLDFPPSMCPASGPPSTWQVPSLSTESAIAEWLRLSLGELTWFTGRYRSTESRAHQYTYEWREKKSGGRRLLEKPKEALKLYQRKILSQILERIPPHPAVHSFLKQRSVLTYVRPHVGRSVVLRMDLEDFFPSLTATRVQALFRTAGYPDKAAQILSALVSHATPSHIIAEAPPASRERLAYPHLPQGAPTSAALSNLLLYRFDTRLAGLAQSVGAAYTRYADDLAFSGDGETARVLASLIPQVAAIALQEGLSVNHRKTRYMRENQQQYLGGQVINKHPNIRRADYERLRAILHNARRHGAATQFSGEDLAASRMRLQGKIAWVSMVHPAKGKRLQAAFDEIDWA